MIELRLHERYRLSLEGGLAVTGSVAAHSDAQVALEIADAVPWGALLRIERRRILDAERVWMRPPRRVEVDAQPWESGGDWLVWPAGTQPLERRKRWRPKAKHKPLLPDAVELASEALATEILATTEGT